MQWVTAAGTVTLTGKQRSFRTTEITDEVDLTSGENVVAHYVPTVMGSEAGMSIVDILGSQGTAGTLNWSVMAPTTPGTLHWGPYGTATNAVKYQQAAKVLTSDREFPYADVVIYDLRWRLSGLQMLYISGYGAGLYGAGLYGV